MSLLLKRRSRSETRAQPKQQQETPSKQQQQQQHQQTRQQQQQQQQAKPHRESPSSVESLQRLGLCPGMGRRKTSAELISEAKLFLGDATATATAMTAAGGARLVSTRRPITPREPGRVLYGKVALAGRPPSAFS